MAGKIVDITGRAARVPFLPAAAFLPSTDALPAGEPLQGHLRIQPATMQLRPTDPLRHSGVAARLDLFPAVACGLACAGDRLRWATQAPISGFADRADGSFWNVILQPGRVWREPQDDGWCRAAFPFALVNPLENETYNGLALFGYRDGRVTPLRFQVEQQTAPFILREYMLATGIADAGFEAEAGALPAADDEFECLPWSKLAGKAGAAVLEPFDRAVGSDALVASGIDCEGGFHLRQFAGREGDWPYPSEARLGIWSVTKSAMAGVAALRLAQMCGEDILDQPVVDHVPELAEAPGWRRVRIRHALSMATAVASRLDGYSAHGVDDNGIAPGYRAWYLAPSIADKLSVIAEDSIAEDWEPGTVFRYRDQDLFTVGLAMDRFAAKHLGRTLETILREDVYGPIGMRETSWATTVEADGAPGAPLWAIGYYPTLGDLAKIARLIHAGGSFEGRQILSRPLIRQIFAGGGPDGVATDRLGDLKCTYFLTFWCAAVRDEVGTEMVVPTMLGYGGNEVLLAPNGVTIIRVAKELPPASHDFRDLATLGLRLARRIGSPCPHDGIRSGQP